MHKYRKDQAGFTLVELLIVIVVIAILAAISIVAYNGIQNRAKNTQTVSALTAWVKGIHSYRIENGSWPAGWVCLGEGYKYGISGQDETGTAQCRKEPTNNGFVVNTAFNDMMKPYLGGSVPTPAMVTVSIDDTVWRRGLMYTATGGNGDQVYIQAAYAGSGDCPSISAVRSVTRSAYSNGIMCNYVIGTQNDAL